MELSESDRNRYLDPTRALLAASDMEQAESAALIATARLSESRSMTFGPGLAHFHASASSRPLTAAA